MGEVITGRFGSASAHGTCVAAGGTQLTELLFGYDEDRAARDFEYIKRDRLIVESVSNRADEMRKHIFLLRRMSDDGMARVERARESMMHRPLHELCEMIMLSNRDQWVLMAPYYGGLVLEFIARLYQADIYASDAR